MFVKDELGKDIFIKVIDKTLTDEFIKKQRQDRREKYKFLQEN